MTKTGTQVDMPAVLGALVRVLVIGDVMLRKIAREVEAEEGGRPDHTGLHSAFIREIHFRPAVTEAMRVCLENGLDLESFMHEKIETLLPGLA